MSNPVTRIFHAPVLLLLVASILAIASGCSSDEDKASATTNPVRQAQAVQSSIASAQAANDPRGDMPPDGGGAPMAMPAPSASPPMNMGAPAGGAPIGMTPTGMARMLGQPPMAGGGGGPSGGLPAAMGAPHIYHVAADSFFLDQATAVGLTEEQQKRLTALKEKSAVAYATTQRKIDQGEQDLWVLSSSEAPDIAKIEMKIGETARLTGQQRMTFIRTVGEAVGVLSDAQRKAVTSMPPNAMPAASASSMGAGAPPAPMGMGMGGKKPMGMGMGAMPAPSATASAMPAAPGGMGHM